MEASMAVVHGFERLREQQIPELRTRAELFWHVKTGAELLSLVNDDDNKVFGISFRTPPYDSTGLPHILEHSVLCGSRKYPVKEPFVELLKGSLQTFLNAMTYPDKTCYPVASQNLQDFYNLIDVYLDAVFYPLLSPFIFQQEGWHYELEQEDAPLEYKGVVFNEMKGAYSSPDSLLAEYYRQSLFPDNAYAFDSGGNPEHIPMLTFDQFRSFHQKYYHPSNARIFFSGDDDPEKRLSLVNDYLKDFEKIGVFSAIAVQKPFHRPRRLVRSFASGKDTDASKGMLTVNWLLDETTHVQHNLGFHILEYMLLGMPGSPLRKALIDSKLGEDIAGEGLGSELRQMYFSTGLKGIDPGKADEVEALVLDTLTGLTREGIDPLTIEAALNTLEFTLRENNTGSFPRGLVLMLRALTTWLYDGDPLALISFESPLEAMKSRIRADTSYFEDLVERFLLSNPHRTTLLMVPDPDLEEKENAAERKKLAGVRDAMGPQELQHLIRRTEKLKSLQEAQDPPEALATIPSLKLTDLDRKNKSIPLSREEQKGATVLYHDLFTNGIAYLDMGFDLRALPQNYLPYARLFGRALLEMGTEKEDFVTLTQRISRKTGGIRLGFHTTAVKNEGGSSARLFLRGKAMYGQMEELLEILKDILLSVRLDNRDRFRQIVLEEKVRMEHKLVPNGHQMVNLRLRAHFSKADWAAEQMSGLSCLFFLRRLARTVDESWKSILTDLEEMKRLLVNRNAILVNATLDNGGWHDFQPLLGKFLEPLPVSPPHAVIWSPDPMNEFEGLTIPAQVNYVGKGANIYGLGYRFHGSAHTITRYLRTAWLWERIRVRGGAYGSFCLFDRLSGILTFVSYRDPNLRKTLEAFDESARFLNRIELSDEELTKSIIGSIADMDKYRLPDAKGYVSMLRHLSGETDEDRQKMREEILGTTASDFRRFGDALEAVRTGGIVKVLGSQRAIQDALAESPGWLNVVKVI
jgi:Zn-dependent M16 (insulinase) family peptidase